MRAFILVSTLFVFLAGIGAGRWYQADKSSQRIKELEDTLLMNGSPNTVFQLPAVKPGEAVQ